MNAILLAVIIIVVVLLLGYIGYRTYKRRINVYERDEPVTHVSEKSIYSNQSSPRYSPKHSPKPFPREEEFQKAKSEMSNLDDYIINANPESFEEKMYLLNIRSHRIDVSNKFEHLHSLREQWIKSQQSPRN